MVAPTLPPRPSHRQTSLARLNSRLSPLPCRLAVTGRQAVCWKRQYPRRPRCCGRLGRGARTGWPRKRGHGGNIGLERRGRIRHPSPRTDAGRSTCPTMTVSGSRGQIATLRKIDKRSAERLVRRRGWRRQPDNGGFVRVYVPVEVLGPETAPDTGPDTAAFASAIATFEATVTVIKGELSRAHDGRTKPRPPPLRRASC